MNRTSFFNSIRLCLAPVFLAALLATGCDKSPIDRTKSMSSGGTGGFGATSSYVIFSNELLSGGGAFLYPGSEGQSLTFNDTSNPISNRSIRYHWTGEAVNGSIDFAGFDLMHTPTQSTYSSTVGRDLHNAGYTRVSFYARGTVGSYVVAKVEVADDGNTGTANTSCVTLSTGTMDTNTNPCGRTDQISSAWTRYTIPIASPATALLAVKDFFKVTFVYNNPNPGSTAPSQGGTIYIDQIQYEP